MWRRISSLSRIFPSASRRSTAIAVNCFDVEAMSIPVVSVSDGLSVAHRGMRYSLVSRELIADSVEASTEGHQWDGIFAVGGCDKNLPGLMMGMLRCNVPAVFVHGTKDPFGSIAELETAIAAIPAPTRLIPIDGAGHDLKRGKADFAAVVSALLEAV